MNELEADLRPHLARDGQLSDRRELDGQRQPVQDADDQRHQRARRQPDVYVLVTLRSDASMIGAGHGRRRSPRRRACRRTARRPRTSTQYPTGTDATYVALVDTFAHPSFVLFGLTNEPGGNKLSNASIAAAMSHAVGDDPRRGGPPRRPSPHRLGAGQWLDERHQLLRDQARSDHLRQRRLRGARLPRNGSQTSSAYKYSNILP